jgi:hypothetical protein
MLALCRSKQARVAKPQKTAAPDTFYNTDVGGKQSLATQVECSPVLYANMAHSSVQRSGFAVASSCPPDIGPGSYTAPVKSDIRVSLVLNQNPLSRYVDCFGRSLSTFSVHAACCAEATKLDLHAACFHGLLGWQRTKWILQRIWEARGNWNGT